MALLLTDIGHLIQARHEAPGLLRGSEMDELPVLKNAWLVVDDGLFQAFGQMEDISTSIPEKYRGLPRTSMNDAAILPTWVDSHTHLVHATSREGEFEDRIKGMSYEEIASRGGGILNSARKLREMPEDALFEEALERLRKVVRMGTGAIEIKSGYGLTLESELKMLRVVRRLKQAGIVPIRSTFLGAHAVPEHHNGNKDAYVEELITEMIPAVAAEGLADYIDVFCERGYFDLDDLHRILEAGVEHGMKPKTHVNQFSAMGGVAKSVEFGAVSVDHLEELEEGDIEALSGQNTVAVALPLCSLFLSIPYTPARRLIDAGLPVALATDFNPGSAPSGNMHLATALGSVKMKMTPAEAINASTINAAHALELGDTVGSITPGLQANFQVTAPLKSPALITYAFGENPVRAVYLAGKKFT